MLQAGLPIQLSSFVGRESEIAEIDAAPDTGSAWWHSLLHDGRRGMPLAS